MLDTAHSILQSTFGYSAFRGEQAAIIAHLLEGGDALVVMPTGSGKSLCFQIPALLVHGITIVVSPLIALMDDQRTTLTALGIPVASLHSGQNTAEQRQTIQALHAGQIKLLYIAPERLLQERTLTLLESLPVRLFAIDEAHCVSEWGHDFRPEYLALGQLRQRFAKVPRLALTATADSRTRADILARLAMPQARIYLASFDRPNIRYQVVAKEHPRKQLLDFLDKQRGNAGIIYCLSRKKVAATSAFLNTQGYPALAYHAGLPTETRSSHQKRFLQEEGLIMVATIAFGMGIHKSNLRFVAHLDTPKSLEAYYQETGRAGRDGLPAWAWMPYGLADVQYLKKILHAPATSPENQARSAHQVQAMLDFCETTGCRRTVLLGYFEESTTQPCGACDRCLDTTTWEATEPARQALSAVFRSKQRYSIAHLIDILLGKNSARVRAAGHQHLSVFGIGQALAESDWRIVFRHLIARGMLALDPELAYRAQLTPACRPVLRGEAAVCIPISRAQSPAIPANASAYALPHNALPQTATTICAATTSTAPRPALVYS